VKVVINRWGKPSIQSGKKYFSIPAGKDPLELELEECLIIAGFKKAKKNTKSKAKNEKPEVKTDNENVKSVKLKVKQPSPVKTPKLKIVKAKRKFAGKKK
jgi:topoisomerase IA-like protein